MIDKKNTFLFPLVSFVHFLRGANFVRGAFEDCPVAYKIFKNAKSDPRVLKIDDDRKFA